MPASVSDFPEQDEGAPREGDAGNSCRGEIAGRDRISPENSMRKPATPLAGRKFPDQVY